MVRPSQLKHVGSTRFWVLAVFLVFVFLTGGGSRPDIQSLVFLRPVAVLVCGYAAWTLRGEHVRRFWVLCTFAAATFLALAIQLVPLPPSIWMQLPGRDVVRDIDRIAGLGMPWRPISLTPVGTWNALYSLFVPLAVLLLAIQVPREERFHLLAVLIGLGVISGILGLMQVSGPVGGPLYLYGVTNDSSAVGLFANRNHAAVLLACLFPMLAVFASASGSRGEDGRWRIWGALILGFLIVPQILVTGSRAGLLLAGAALLAIPFLHRPPATMRGSSRWRLAYLLILVAVLGLSTLVVVSSHDETFIRLMETSRNEARFQFWGPIADLAWRYFPMGSGAGSFVEIYQLHEPYDHLRINYLNHAHNDWLELYLTNGLIALALIAIAVLLWVRRSAAVWTARGSASRQISYARMASVVLLMLGLASVGDYPLRAPSMICLFVVMAVWLSDSRTEPQPSRSQASPNGNELPAVN